MFNLSHKEFLNNHTTVKSTVLSTCSTDVKQRSTDTVRASGASSLPRREQSALQVTIFPWETIVSLSTFWNLSFGLDIL